MPLPIWEVVRIPTPDIEGWQFQTSLLVRCPRCKDALILPLSWRKKNKYGTAPCPFCFKTSRIPKGRFRTQL